MTQPWPALPEAMNAGGDDGLVAELDPECGIRRIVVGHDDRLKTQPLQLSCSASGPVRLRGYPRWTAVHPASALSFPRRSRSYVEVEVQ